MASTINHAKIKYDTLQMVEIFWKRFLQDLKMSMESNQRNIKFVTHYKRNLCKMHLRSEAIKVIGFCTQGLVKKTGLILFQSAKTLYE